MTSDSMSTEPDARLGALLDRLATALRELIHEFDVTEDELVRACRHLDEITRSRETFLLAEVLGLSTAADDVTHAIANEGGTASNILGPFYRADRPRLHPPYVLPRPVERGPSLFFRGRIVDGRTKDPIGPATIDVWQADAQGVYDLQRHPDGDVTYLRGVLSTEEDGWFEIATELPGAYEVPKDGPVGVLLARTGRTAFRPKHMHFRITVAGYEGLTTQIYFEGDPWLRSDVIRAVKPTLIVGLHRANDRPEPEEDIEHGYLAEYTFELVRRPGRPTDGLSDSPT